jgi:hypothetical protein
LTGRCNVLASVCHVTARPVCTSDGAPLWGRPLRRAVHTQFHHRGCQGRPVIFMQHSYPSAAPRHERFARGSDYPLRPVDRYGRHQRNACVARRSGAGNQCARERVRQGVHRRQLLVPPEKSGSEWSEYFFTADWSNFLIIAPRRQRKESLYFLGGLYAFVRVTLSFLYILVCGLAALGPSWSKSLSPRSGS